MTSQNLDGFQSIKRFEVDFRFWNIANNRNAQEWTIDMRPPTVRNHLPIGTDRRCRHHVAGRHRAAAVAGVVGDADQVVTQVVGEAGFLPGGIDGSDTPPTGVVAGAGDPILAFSSVWNRPVLGTHPRHTMKIVLVARYQRCLVEQRNRSDAQVLGANANALSSQIGNHCISVRRVIEKSRRVKVAKYETAIRSCAYAATRFSVELARRITASQPRNCSSIVTMLMATRSEPTRRMRSLTSGWPC
jgi:hypothetical protein